MQLFSFCRDENITVSIHVIAENCFIKVIREPIGIGYKMFMKLRKLNELSHVRKSMQNGNEFLNDFSLILINDFSLKMMNFDVILMWFLFVQRLNLSVKF